VRRLLKVVVDTTRNGHSLAQTTWTTGRVGQLKLSAETPRPDVLQLLRPPLLQEAVRVSELLRPTLPQA
jgi:hypothetical protein